MLKQHNYEDKSETDGQIFDEKSDTDIQPCDITEAELFSESGDSFESEYYSQSSDETEHRRSTYGPTFLFIH